MNDSPKPLQGLAAAMADTDRTVYLILRDDADSKPEIAIGTTRALYRFGEVSISWNAHLFGKIKSNTRDDPRYNDNIRLASEVEACAAISAEPAKWLPIDSAPRKGVWALVYAEGAMNCAFVERGKLPEDWCHAENPNVHPEYVTHWMPLPAGPGVSAVQQAAPDAAPMGQAK